MDNSSTNMNKGFSLLEMVVYVAILSLLMVVVVQTVLGISGSYAHIALKRSIEESAMTSLERITREIRNANGGTTGTSLSLTSKKDDGSTATYEFYVDGNHTLRMREDAVEKGPLSKNNVKVTDFSTMLMSTTTSKAVKINMTIEATKGSVTESESFHSTVVMRGLY